MRFRDIPIHRKLTLIVLASTIMVLLFSNGAFIANEVFDTEESLRSRMQPLAVVMGAQTVVALTFNDVVSSEEYLTLLNGDPGIAEAVLYDADGQEFARFSRDGRDVVPRGEALFLKVSELDLSGVLLFQKGYAHFLMPILLQGDRVGAIRLIDDQQAAREMLMEYLAISAAIICLSLGFAFLLSVRLPKVVSEPLQQLMELMQRVTTERNYGAAGEQR